MILVAKNGKNIDLQKFAHILRKIENQKVRELVKE